MSKPRVSPLYDHPRSSSVGTDPVLDPTAVLARRHQREIRDLAIEQDDERAGLLNSSRASAKTAQAEVDEAMRMHRKHHDARVSLAERHARERADVKKAARR